MPAGSWSKTNQDLDRFVKREISRTSVPGVAVGILLRGRRFTNGYGVTNVDHPLPVTSDTLFQIGSTTKTYTATAIMQLVDAGKVHLDVPVRRYLPGFRLKDQEATRKVTLRHLLTHMSGWVGDYFYQGGWGDDALERVVASMSKIKQLTPLGTVWAYSNSSFYVAGRVIERVTRKPYEVAIKEMLFDPLEMTESFFFPQDVMTRRFVVGHITNGKKSTVATPWRGSRSSAPAGAIASSAGDQLKWAAFHMGDGKAPNGNRLLKKSTLRMMQKEHVYVGSMTESMGISWLMSNVGGVKTVRHGGTTVGQLSAFVMVPEKQFAVTVLTNSTAGRTLHPAVVNWALEHYIGVTGEKAPQMKVAPVELAKYEGKYQVAASGGIVEVVAKARRLLLNFPNPQGDTRSAPAMSLPLHFYDTDKFVGSSGAYAGVRGDFLRSPSGSITWVRFGGRLYKKVSDAAAERAMARIRERRQVRAR